jgi:hypothetical protein
MTEVQKMNVLIACEESQEVCKAFRERGHRAFSCDIQECSGGHPEWHIQKDVLQVLNPVDHGNNYLPSIWFKTMDDDFLEVEKWDLIIAHPPCTYMSGAGACRMYPKAGQIDQERFAKAMEAKEFFMKILTADCQKICIENPRPLKCVELPPPSQSIQPYEYGEPWSKLTYLWLKGLPPLFPTEIVQDYKPYVSCGTSRNKGNKDKSGMSRRGGAQKVRSKTFPGIAKAMAEQWG